MECRSGARPPRSAPYGGCEPWGRRHRSLYGLVHGSLLLLVFGVYVGVLGRAKRSLLLGFLGGPAAGLAAAGSFYLLEPFLGYSAMFAAWAFLWVLLGIL